MSGYTLKKINSVSERTVVPSGTFGSNSKKTSNANDILKKLIDLCDSNDATVMSFRVTPVMGAVVEDRLGGLSHMVYHEGEWM